MDESELVRRARGGDAAAFGSLVEMHQDRVLRLVRGLVPPQDAEDVAQDAFVKAFRKLSEFDGRSRFYTWIYRIAANTAMDWRKRESYRRHAPLPEGDEGQDLLPEDAPGPRTRAERNELARAIDAAVAGLSDAHREIVLLREVDGLSYEEIAAELGISKGTVESRLFRARERLRETLGGWMDGGRGDA
ncbi:MAG: ECF RNA polymerase sigma-E factor [Planctomycetes bacterium]|nr:ECF RNA polymerase sigma-E factor [Planctomycetota bacterium]